MKTSDLTTRSLARHLLAAAGALVLFAGAASAADYPTTILNDNPSAYYRFEETSGATAFDSSTNQVNATYLFDSTGSPHLGEPGIDTNSILFTGYASDESAAEVDIPISPLIAPVAANGSNSGPFSAELWVEPTVQPGDYEVPIEVGSYGGGGWNLYVSPGPGASFFVLNMPNGVFFSSFGSAIQFFNWYHLVLTYDGANETLYINGVSTGTFPAAMLAGINTFYANIGSGKNIYLPSAEFNGGVDEVAFYDYVLSPGQITNHYAIGTNSFRPGNLPAGIGSQPSSETNYSGLPVTFSVTASGTPPFTYSWSTNGVVTGPNSSALTFTAQYPGNNNASVKVVVSNPFGFAVTSSVVNLTVLTNLNVLANPTSITRNVGSHAAFHVTADGAVPISYQWSVSADGGNTFTPISGVSNSTATNETLWLSNVQLAQSEYVYSVLVSNPFVAVTSSATLIVQTRSDPPVPLTGYGAIIAADNPVAYWRLDETSGSLAEDAVGTFDGTYTANAGTIGYGATPGIPSSADPAVTLAGGATIQVPWAPELNPDTGWSVETWLQPTSLGANGGDYRVVLSSEYNYFPYALNGWYVYQQPSDTFGWVIQPGNGFIVAGPDDPANNNLLVAGKWYHLVISDDLTNFNMYINGELRTSFPVSGIAFIPDGDGINPDGNAALPGGSDNPDDGGNFVIGQRTDAAFGTFLGTVDDTAVYQYALSPQQVKLHYEDATLLTITPAGANVILSWPVGQLQQSANVTGTYTTVMGATSPYTNAASGTAKYYRVHVP